MIDFGGATYEHDSHASVVNTRQYRAPEVILGLRWLYPSDLWSVGCIIAELFLGDLLFATVRCSMKNCTKAVDMTWLVFVSNNGVKTPACGGGGAPERCLY